ncbi:MAG: S9 family peptidase [Candidatus Cryptobacteroides sp.]|nr:S9 family peptidase [Candidatus Cryptobacteroides sp.]
MKFKTGMAIAATLMLMACNKEQGPLYIGPQEVKIEDGVMTPEVLLALGRVSDPQLSPDGKLILFGVSYQSIEQNRSCRNIYVCNTDGSSRKQLTRSGKSISNARWSADGSEVYFLQGGQIWKAPFKGGKLGKKRQLSKVKAGISGFELSPDGSSLLYVSSIPGPVKTPAASGLDKAQAYVAEDLMYRHWDHWVTETPRSFTARLGEGPITEENSSDILGEGNSFELPTEPFGGTEQLSWAPDSRLIAYSCRKKTGKEYAFSTDTEIYLYDSESGKTSVIPMGGGYDTDPVWSPDGSRIAWISMARDGYEADAQRIMVADVNPGDLSVSGIRQLAAELDRDAAGLKWSANGAYLYFSAAIDGLEAIFRVAADGVSPAERLTPDSWHFDFSSPFAILEDGTLLTSYNSLNFPTELVSVRPSEAFTQITAENASIFARLSEPSSESVEVETVDGKKMQCWVLYPPHFDPSKKYPAIEIVLGGPQGANTQGWSYRWCYRLMAQQGYIVMMPNRRGTTAAGQEWKEQISGDYCGLNMQDYLSAGRYIKAKPYVSKLACCGASYGGYSAYMLEGLHGDLYDCFIAHAGIFDEKMLWFTTEEMWFANWDNGGLTEYAYTPGKTGPAGDGISFGGMQQAGAPYASTPKAVRHYSNSPSSMVTRWHTPILCIHGAMDFRIPYEQGMAAFNAAQMMGVPSKLVVFPEENHWILQAQNALFWHRTYFDWLERWCR